MREPWKPEVAITSEHDTMRKVSYTGLKGYFTADITKDCPINNPSLTGTYTSKDQENQPASMNISISIENVAEPIYQPI